MNAERNSIDFKRGELVGACRAFLAMHCMGMPYDQGNHGTDHLAREIVRLIANEFQMPIPDIGCPVQFSLTVLLMNGEYHEASRRRS
jgi:hypothetical protein